MALQSDSQWATPGMFTMNAQGTKCLKHCTWSH